ncbi:MAG TPA: hypothetical protein VHC49_11335 [Mycobacteriales bacterium]|nr:hypothetical protein [Mycobacteriales bacterium]
MPREAALTVATRFVAERFPDARWALLSDSVVTGRQTAGSDLDIVVLLPSGDPRPPFRASQRFGGWPIETFVYDERSLNHYLMKELPGRRPVLNQMVASGINIGENSTVHLDAVKMDCVRTLEAGPEPLTAEEREWARYRLTDLLDDLVHATDAGERAVIATTIWITAAEQYLVLGNHWSGASKWLIRQLRATDAEFASRWLAARNDPARIAHEVLAALGGPLFDGYHATGETPD